MTWRQRLVFLVALLAAVGSAGGKWWWDRTHQETVQALVVGVDVPAYTTLTERHLAYKSVPRGAIEPSSLQDPRHVLGRVAVVPLFAGEQILTQKLAEAGGAELMPGEREIGIKTDLAQSVGGRVRVGDLVDLYWAPQNQIGARPGMIAEAVRVMDVRTAANQMAGTGIGGASVPAVIVVKLTAAQVASVLEAETRGNLVLARRAPGDTAKGVFPLTHLVPLVPPGNSTTANQDGGAANNEKTAQTADAPQPVNARR